MAHPKANKNIESKVENTDTIQKENNVDNQVEFLELEISKQNNIISELHNTISELSTKLMVYEKSNRKVEIKNNVPLNNSTNIFKPNENGLIPYIDQFGKQCLGTLQFVKDLSQQKKHK